MSDILKQIMHPASRKNDPEGNLLEIGPWVAGEADERARQLGLQMTDDHWDVVLFLRDYFRGRGSQADAREIMEAMEEEFAGDGGRRWLYRLFPGGPVLQASKIAGIPLPAKTVDPASGNVH